MSSGSRLVPGHGECIVISGVAALVEFHDRLHRQLSRRTPLVHGALARERTFVAAVGYGTAWSTSVDLEIDIEHETNVGIEHHPTVVVAAASCGPILRRSAIRGTAEVPHSPIILEQLREILFVESLGGISKSEIHEYE